MIEKPLTPRRPLLGTAELTARPKKRYERALEDIAKRPRSPAVEEFIDAVFHRKASPYTPRNG
jgi:hypothetical protein